MPAEVAAEKAAFTVSRDALARELDLAVGAIETKSTIPILSNVLLELEGNGLLKITGTDLGIGYAARIPITSGRSAAIGATVPARKLQAIVKSLDDEPVEITLAPNVTLECGRARFRLVHMDTDQFPALPSPGEAISVLPAAVLANHLRHVAFSVPGDETRYTVNGVYLGFTPAQLTTVSTDGHRLPNESPVVRTLSSQLQVWVRSEF